MWGLCGGSQTLTHFNGPQFRDYLWWRYFARTLPPEDIDLVTRIGFRVARMPWVAMQLCGYVPDRIGLPALYPRLDTSDIDVLIAQTPFPASVTGRTQLVVRYHDTFPVTTPYTIGERHYHQAFHYQALRHNVGKRAWFACVSEATRQDLLGLFPQVAERSVAIHNMVSHHYFDEASPPERVPEILKMRQMESLHGTPSEERASVAPDYLLIVSRFELRKNYLAVLAAWEHLRSTRFPALQLITVGNIDAHQGETLEKFRPWIEKGLVHMLEKVPSAELRLLYKHARATVCPSVAEGFGYSGVEAMRCGGAVVASDIPVHREIYADAAVYFKPHDLSDAVHAIESVIDPAQGARRAELIERGAAVSARYLSDAIMPQWQAFLQTLTHAHSRPP
jgi:glycosyltransferase involved in cell wall biosynthesis